MAVILLDGPDSFRALHPPAATISPSRRELALAALAAIALAALVFGPQVAHGGFLWDDWQNAANVHFAREPGFLGALSQATERPVFGYRPVLTTMLVAEYRALGQHMHLFLAVAALFGASTAWALYRLLRTLGLAVREALVPAALLLVFPWCDSTRMWNTASFDTLAVTLYLLGLTAAVNALRAPPGRRRALTTAGSLLLFALACWTYEIVTIAVACSVAVYLLVAPRRAALRRFGLDLLLVAVALGVVAHGTTRTPLGLGDQARHGVTLAGQSFSLLTRALIPAGSLPGIVGALMLVALVLAAWRARRRELRRWLVTAALGAVCVFAGYLLFVPAAAYYEPLAPGTTNRMNVLAAVGFVLVVYALIRLAAALLGGRRAPALAALLLGLVAVGYVVRVRDDQTGWARSARVQEQVLSAMRATVPRPPPGSTIYTFSAPGQVAPGIPAFSLSFDLNAAARLRYGDGRLRAFPIRGLDVIRCTPTLLYPVGGTYGPVHGSPYRRAFFVDVRRRSAVRIDGQDQCRRWASLLSAG
jgi:hypothetical protein